MSVTETAERRSVRERLWNPPNGRVSSELEVRTPASFRSELAAECRLLTNDNERLKQQNRELRADLRAALKNLAISKLTIDGLVLENIEAVSSLSSLQSLPEEVPVRAIELEVGIEHQSLKGIILAACQHLGISVHSMMAKNRIPKASHARQMVFHIARSVTTLSSTEIGRRFDLHHTTVLHGLQRVEAKLPTDAKLREDIEAIKAKLAA